MSKKIGKNISFHFHPNNFDKDGHTIEKADGEGKKRRYMCGISSGLKIDEHGERMSDKCIKSFMDQANGSELLLFPDLHGIKESEDIGILTKAEILENGDWYTEYRLYDESDGIGANKLEKIDTLWKQINGLPPYQKKRQKGFSIEGVIPDESIVMNNMGQADRSIIDDILLDGVVLVPRPAYKDSIATAIYKALGEVIPFRETSIKQTIRENAEAQDIEDNYYKYKWKYLDALEQTIEDIMKRKNNHKMEELSILFDEFKDLMVALIINSERMFADEQSLDLSLDINGDDNTYTDQIHSASIEEEENQNPKLEMFKSLYSQLLKLADIMEGKNVKTY